MDTNNWRPPPGGEPAMDAGDWRSQLQADSRQRIVNKIMDTLKRHLPFSGQEGLQELKKIADRFEEKIYTAATSQSDYLRKISLKMLTMESKSLNPIVNNTLPSNSAVNSNRAPDPGSFGMQAQAPNQGQSLSMPVPANQSQTRHCENHRVGRNQGRGRGRRFEGQRPGRRNGPRNGPYDRNHRGNGPRGRGGRGQGPHGGNQNVPARQAQGREARRPQNQNNLCYRCGGIDHWSRTCRATNDEIRECHAGRETREANLVEVPVPLDTTLAIADFQAANGLDD